jgi:FkbM family methyltransferase
MNRVTKSLLWHARAIACRHPNLGRWMLKAIPDVHWTVHPGLIGPFIIRLRRNRSYWLRSPWLQERFVLGCFLHFVRPGDVVYDVGANIGLYVRLMRYHLGASTVAFEPMTENRALLLRNAADINDGRTLVLPFALTDRDGEEELQLDLIMSGSAALSAVTAGRPSTGHEQYGIAAQTERVPVRRLDTIAAELDLASPRLIKVDVEGAAGLVVEGARETLLRYRPVVVVECHSLGELRDVFRVLSELGYFCATRSEWCYAQLTKERLGTLDHIDEAQYLVASTDEREIMQPIPEPDLAIVARQA